MQSEKSLLHEVREEYKEIQIIRRQIEQAELSLLPSAIRYDREKVQTTPDDPMLHLAVRLDKYIGDLQKHMAVLIAKRRKAMSKIARIKDSRQRKVLELYFIDERILTMQEVADEMHYTKRWTYTLYKQAMKNIR